MIFRDPKLLVDALLGGDEHERPEGEPPKPGEEIDWSEDPDDPDAQTSTHAAYATVVSERREWVESNLEWDEYAELWCVKYCGFSDYSGSTVERSNSEVLDEKFDFVQTATGGHGSVWTGIPEEALGTVSDEDWDSFKEVVEGLDGYPLLDDEHHSEMEMKLQNEAWDSDYRDELKKEAIRKTDDPLMKFTYASMTDAEWDAVRYELEGHGDGRFEWHDEHGSMYVNVERAFERMDKDELPDYSTQFAAAALAVWNDWLCGFFEALLTRRGVSAAMLATASAADLWSLFKVLEQRYEHLLWDVDKDDASLSVDKDAVREMVALADTKMIERIRRPETDDQRRLPGL